ncbi:hypothetical protein ACHAWF_015869 [Thalassiosira exigua]
MSTANRNADWIRYGDRSHSNLKLIDELRYELNYEGHCEDMEKLEEEHLNGRQREFEDLLFHVREKQRINDGDRTHPRLVELDSLRENLSYDGWQNDFDCAFAEHLKVGADDILNSFSRMIASMKRKQSMYLGNHSHENLVFLHSLNLSFPGWEQDVQKAVDHHRSGFNIDYYRFSLVEMERMFQGDRSHPRLVALDSLQLTYKGWKKDVEEAEYQHVGCPILYHCGVHKRYQEHLEVLSKKQEAHASRAGRWMHPVQRQVLEANWSYAGWQDGVEAVRNLDPSPSNSYTFDVHLEKYQLRQMLHDNNFREHPALIMLDELQLCYPGWETDYEDAKNHLRENGYGLEFPFQSMILGMKNKQAIFFDRKREVESKSRPSSAASANSPNGHPESCAICFEAPRTHIFVPCGHACACKSCAAAVMVMNKKCPICNKRATLTMEMFFS